MEIGEAEKLINEYRQLKDEADILAEIYNSRTEDEGWGSTQILNRLICIGRDDLIALRDVRFRNKAKVLREIEEGGMDSTHINRAEELIRQYRELERQVRLIEDKANAPMVCGDFGHLYWLKDNGNQLALSKDDLTALKELRVKEMREIESRLEEL